MTSWFVEWGDEEVGVARNYLKGNYKDADVIEMINDPFIKEMIAEYGITTLGQWKCVGRRLKTILSQQDLTMGDIRASLYKWGKEFNKGVKDDG